MNDKPSVGCERNICLWEALEEALDEGLGSCFGEVRGVARGNNSFAGGTSGDLGSVVSEGSSGAEDEGDGCGLDTGGNADWVWG